MDLLIILNNTETDRCNIEDALRNFDCSLIIEDERVVIRTSSLVDPFDVNDNDAVSQVWEDVYEFIDIVNGSAVIEGVSMNPLNLHYVKYIDENTNANFLPNIGNIHLVAPGLRTSEPDISKIIPLALHNDAIAKVLRLCGRDLDWINLYRVYEVISEDAKWVENKNIKIFKASANNSSVTGDHSRHGKMNVGSPKETMRLADAQHLIKSKVREWLYGKIEAE